MNSNSHLNTVILDNIYRNRWQEYYLADGKKFDSREIYWRMIPWNQVTKIITYISNKKHLMHSNHQNFKFFVVYRWTGYDSKKGTISEWAVGWSDGKVSFMIDIDFRTGKIVKQYIVNNNEIRGHIYERHLS